MEVPSSVMSLMQQSLLFVHLLSPQRSDWIQLANENPAEMEVLAESIKIPSYQLYLVEQWVPNRKHRTKSIAVYTGDKSHQIDCCLVRVTQKQADFQAYISEEKTRPMDVDSVAQQFPQAKGAKIYLTNLGAFSSQLNIILVPDGDFDKNLPKFTNNLNLRRFACSGRSALTLAPPSDAQIERFHQIYKTNSALSFEETVVELVKLVQCGLMLFGKLSDTMATDGLLCDDTCSALTAFHDAFGPFEMEVQGSMADPVLIAELLSKVVTIRNKLNSMGDQCPKNPFYDRETFSQAVQAYQKSHKLEPTGILDPITIDRIDESYARSSPPLKVSKVLKSKIEDIAGSHHGGSAHVETSDLEQIGRTTNIDVFRVLWGKKGKATAGDESSVLAEGRKELKNMLKKNRGGPEKIRDGGTMMRDLRTNMAESISRISNTVEDFVDRRLVARLQKISPTKAIMDVSEENMELPSGEYAITEGFDLQRTPRPVHTRQQSIDFLNTSAESAQRSRDRAYSQEMVMDDSREVWHQRAITDPSLFQYRYESEMVKHQVQQLQKHELGFIETVEKLKAVARNFDLAIQALSEMYIENWQQFSDLEGLLNGLIQDYKAIQARIDSLDTKASKVSYDMNVLDDKVRETDDIVENFFREVSNFQQQVQATVRKNEANQPVIPMTTR